MVTLGNGESYETNMFVAIREPPRFYVRMSEMSMPDAYALASNADAWTAVTYGKTMYRGCAVLGVLMDNGLPKFHASYTDMVRIGE